MNSAQHVEKGRQLMAEAERAAQSKSKGGFFRFLVGSSGGGGEAADLFVKAANSFKIAKSWDLTGDAFVRAAQIYERSSDLSYDAASKYVDAAKAYKNCSNEKAANAYNQAIRMYTEAARFQQCARLSKELAELHEADKNYPAALASYKAAADFYDGEDAKSQANAMRLKVASLSASAGKYAEAAELFEKVGTESLQNNLLKYGARDHFLRAGLCRLCLDDYIGAERAVETYTSLDSSFASSREGQLLAAVVKTVGEGDAEAFTNAVYDYDSISKLDDWKTSVLLKIKHSIRDAEEDLT